MHEQNPRLSTWKTIGNFSKLTKSRKSVVPRYDFSFVNRSLKNRFFFVMYMKKKEREREWVETHRAVRIDPRKTKDEGETKSTARTHVHLRRWRANIGVFRTRNSITWEDRLGKLPLPRLPFRRQRNVTSLLGRGEEPWVSCLSIVEHAIGESSRFVLLFLLFFFFFFSSLSLFFFFSSKKINVIDLSSIPILLYHQFLRSFIFNFSVCVICVCVCVCVLFLCHYLSLMLFFSVASKEIGSNSTDSKGEGGEGIALYEILLHERATRVSYRSRLSLEN